MSRGHSDSAAARKGGALALLLACLIGAAAFAPAPARAQDDTLFVTLTGSSGQQASGLFESAITGNVVNDIGNVRATVLDASFTANRGIGQLNQDTGIASNQANVVLITLIAGAESDGVQMISHAGTSAITGNTLVVEGGSRSNLIRNSFADSAGLFQVNQNAGALNQQLNFMALSVGNFVGTSIVALADTSLDGVAAGNDFTMRNAGPRSDTIDGSFSGFRGVAQITQSSGDGNAIMNSTVIGVVILNVR